MVHKRALPYHISQSTTAVYPAHSEHTGQIILYYPVNTELRALIHGVVFYIGVG